MWLKALIDKGLRVFLEIGPPDHFFHQAARCAVNASVALASTSFAISGYAPFAKLAFSAHAR